MSEQPAWWQPEVEYFGDWLLSAAVEPLQGWFSEFETICRQYLSADLLDLMDIEATALNEILSARAELMAKLVAVEPTRKQENEAVFELGSDLRVVLRRRSSGRCQWQRFEGCEEENREIKQFLAQTEGLRGRAWLRLIGSVLRLLTPRSRPVGGQVPAEMEAFVDRARSSVEDLLIRSQKLISSFQELVAERGSLEAGQQSEWWSSRCLRLLPEVSTGRLFALEECSSAFGLELRLGFPAIGKAPLKIPVVLDWDPAAGKVRDARLVNLPGGQARSLREFLDPSHVSKQAAVAQTCEACKGRGEHRKLVPGEGYPRGLRPWFSFVDTTHGDLMRPAALSCTECGGEGWWSAADSAPTPVELTPERHSLTVLNRANLWFRSGLLVALGLAVLVIPIWLGRELPLLFALLPIGVSLPFFYLSVGYAYHARDPHIHWRPRD